MFAGSIVTEIIPTRRTKNRLHFYSTTLYNLTGTSDPKASPPSDMQVDATVFAFDFNIK